MILLTAFLLAACTTQSVLRPYQVAGLHSGRMIIAVPKRAYFTLAPPNAKARAVAMAWFDGWLIGGAAGGIVVGSIVDAAYKNDALFSYLALKPYTRQIRAMHFKRRFLAAGRSVADQIRWMGKTSSVVLYRGSGVPDFGESIHLVQSGKTQALVLVKCALGFSSDMEKLYVVAQVQVYARGSRRGELINGTTIRADTQLQDTGPALEPYGVEGIAASKHSDRGAIGARANVWFEKNGRRYKKAVFRDIGILRATLFSYLNGGEAGDSSRRVSLNPHK